MTSRQLNIRLDPLSRDRLEALAFVRRQHASSLARAIVLEYLSVHAHESGLERALQALTDQDRANDARATVHPLRPKNP